MSAVPALTEPQFTELARLTALSPRTAGEEAQLEYLSRITIELERSIADQDTADLHRWRDQLIQSATRESLRLSAFIRAELQFRGAL